MSTQAMIPLRDSVPSERTPIVTYAIIGITALVFVAQLMEGSDAREPLVYLYGMIPARVLDPDSTIEIPLRIGFHVVRETVPPSPLPEWLTLLTCVFLHGGWLHFLGNMWILYIFGDNIEDRLGRLGYVAFYLSCGVLASVTHLVAYPSSTVPTIGASGAIAGVMGAYFLLYPHARVLTLVPIFFFLEIMVLPAPLFLGFWFLLQFFQGTLAIGSTSTGGVAWWAHIGGFVVGSVTAFLLRRANWLRPPPSAPTPSPFRYRVRFPPR